MNNTRRKTIRSIIGSLELLKSKIEMLYDEESDALVAMEENFSETERYAMAEEATENLESAMDMMDDVISALEEAAN